MSRSSSRGPAGGFCHRMRSVSIRRRSMRGYRSFVTALAAAVLVTAFASVISAHHSMAGYDDTKKITLTGTVSEYRWRNPHAWVVWDVKDDSGKVVQWSGELPAINTDQALGMSK